MSELLIEPMSKKTPVVYSKIKDFEKSGFGLFIHYGLFSIMGEGEWIQDFKHIPVDEYAKLKDQFSATDFDADRIVKLAKQAGMQYACLTTRHHEGFSLYDTCGLDTFDSIHSPAKRDLVREFVDACNRNGVKPFLYHTLLDWRWDTGNCSTERFNEYLAYLYQSVELLCKNYGEIGGFWFDGTWSREGADWQEDKLYGMIRSYQPDAIITNNTGLHARGDVGNEELDCLTFEQGLPVAPDRSDWSKYMAGEMCETINGHWGVGKADFDYKSPSTLIRNLCQCRKVGANYLLNIGPEANGSVSLYDTTVLTVFGKWMQYFGESIYEVQPTEFDCFGDDFILKGNDCYYYFCFDLAVAGSAHVVTGSGTDYRLRSFPFDTGLVESIEWIDNGGEVKLLKDIDGQTIIDVGSHDYGENFVVRVARLHLT
jgi:alpha-L-fucosidase